jgi:CHASE3 domain sensor protein
MRLNIPPFLPPYVVLFLVVAYAIGSLWLGLARLADITRLTDSMTKSRATIEDVQALQAALSEIEAVGSVGVPASADSLAEAFERGRGRVPPFLFALRDKVRDDPSELALVEELVPLIAERMTLAAASIEQRRGGSAPSGEGLVDQSGKETFERIRAIMASVKDRELGELERDRDARHRTMAEARRDLYVMAGVTLLLVVALFAAVRRLRSFLAVVPGRGETDVAMPSDRSSELMDAVVETLLRDAMLRARIAEAAAPAGSGSAGRLRALVAAIEQALRALADARDDDSIQSEAQGIAGALTLLARGYSRPEGLTVRATIDQNARIRDAQRAFLIVRSAEWALEAIALRKRAGNATLEVTANDGRVLLRVHALTDNPKLPVALTPKESQEANALRQGVTALGGTFMVGEGPTGFSLTLTLPAEP